jgi:hypothetical protein
LVAFRPRDHPSSADLVKASTQHLSSDRRTYWRDFFDALSIVRNKCSHGHIDPELTVGEMGRLAKGGLGGLLGSEKLQFAADAMAPIMKRLIQFFEGIAAAPS